MGFMEIILGNEKEKQLFAHLNSMADYILRASEFFLELCLKPDRAFENAKLIRFIEHDCDQAAAQIFQILNSVSQLPFHHEDIAELVGNLDSILDFIWGAADRIVFRYELPEFEKETELLTLVQILNEMIRDLKEIVTLLNNLKKIKDLHEIVVSFHAKENKTDDLRAEAVKRWHKTSLANPTATPLRIAWAEVYDRLEWAANRCVDVVDILGRFFQKYS